MLIMKFILFGATGDLARSRLIPQLINLANVLPTNFELIAVGRRKLDTQEFLDFLEPDISKSTVQNLNPTYIAVDFETSNGFAPLFANIYASDVDRRVFYFSLGPEPMMKAIERFCDDQNCRILKYENSIVATEKPFGSSLRTAQMLNSRLLGIANEEQIYRVDHYLHKDTSKRIIDYRKEHNLVGDFWQQVKQINVIASEQLLVGSRAEYYDKEGGAINDWVQNHLLGLLALTITPELDITCHDCRTQALSCLSAQIEELKIGQYEGYLNEPGIGKDSHTETFAAVKLKSTSSDLANKPIYLITGKGLAEKLVVIEILLNDGTEIKLEIDPSSEEKPLGKQLHDAFYNVLHDLILQKRDYFVGSQEIITQWQICDPINAQKAKMKLITYPVGSRYQKLLEWE